MNIPNIVDIARYLFCLYTLFTVSALIRCSDCGRAYQNDSAINQDPYCGIASETGESRWRRKSLRCERLSSASRLQ